MFEISHLRTASAHSLSDLGEFYVEISTVLSFLPHVEPRLLNPDPGVKYTIDTNLSPSYAPVPRPTFYRGQYINACASLSFNVPPIFHLRRLSNISTSPVDRVNQPGMLPAATTAIRSWRAPRPRSSLFTRGLSGLTINSGRLMETLHQTCQWGAAHPYGKSVYLPAGSPPPHNTRPC